MTRKGRLFIDLFEKSTSSVHENTLKRVLSEREQTILLEAYDFKNEEFNQIERIALKHSISAQRVRQIKNKAISKLLRAGVRETQFVPDCKELVDLVYPKEIEFNIPGEYCEYLMDFTRENLSEYPSEDIYLLLAQLKHLDYKVVHRVRYDIRKIKREQERREGVDKRRMQRFFKSQQKFLDGVVWFDHVKKCDLEELKKIEPKRGVNEEGDGYKGRFFSYKTDRYISFESGIERKLIEALETFPNVKHIVEQPFQIKYVYKGYQKTYTPDFLVMLDDYSAFIVEVKGLTKCDMKVQLKFEKLIEFCIENGFGAVLTDGHKTLKDVISFNVNESLENEMSNRLSQKGGRSVFYKELYELKTEFNSTWMGIMNIIFKNNWTLYNANYRNKDDNKTLLTAKCTNELYRKTIAEAYELNL